MTQRVLGPTGGRRKRLLIGPALLTLLVSALAVLLASPLGTSAPSNPSITLDQCRNGALATPNDCLLLPGGSSGWVNGNAGKTNAHFIEGHSIPYRARMENVTATPSPGFVELVLGYDIKHSDKNAIDFLTYYDQLEPHMPPFDHSAEEVDPPDGTALDGETEATAEIPKPQQTGDPGDRFDALRAAGKTKMAIWGGEFVGGTDAASADGGTGALDYVQEGDLTTGNAETQIRVRFRDTDGDGIVVLGWGGHIARSTDWGTGNSASAVNGSPYHMRTKSWTIGNVGNQDRSLKADAVIPVGTIKIVKDAVPDGAQDFAFTTNFTPASFSLDDDADGTLPNFVQYTLIGGNYTVSETDPTSSGYKLTNLQCVGGGANTSTSIATGGAGGTATIGLDNDETVVCTFTNTKPTRLKIVKVLSPSSDSGKFNLQIDGTTVPTTGANVGDGGDTGFIEVTAGAHTAGETAGTSTSLADYATTISCTGGFTLASTAVTGATSRSVNVNLPVGTDTTCTITNTRRSFIIVTYVCEGSQLYQSSVTFSGSTKNSEATGSASLPSGTTESQLCSAMDARFDGVTSGTGKTVTVDISP